MHGRRRCRLQGRHQMIAVLDHVMNTVTQTRLGAFALTHLFRVRGGGRYVGGIAAFFIVKIPFLAQWAVIVIIAPAETLVRSPGIDQRAIDAETIRRQELLLACNGQHRLEQLRQHRVVEQRSRFLLKVEWCQTLSSISKPTNQRYSML